MLNTDFEGISERDGLHQIRNGVALYAKELIAEEAKDSTAIFIHGAEGNHTIVRRPSCYMINKGYFSRIIMPDRRGADNSSPMTSIMDSEDNALDMKFLLDKMGVNEKITAIGMSLGGPIALALASLDQRIERVILIASSPLIRPYSHLFGFFYRSGFEEKFSRMVYLLNLGKNATPYPDYDAVYDAKGLLSLIRVFITQIQHTKKNLFQSKVFEKKSIQQLANADPDNQPQINIPVFQVIGTRDKTWEIDMMKRYTKQIPCMTSKYIKNASHTDIFLRASEFYGALDGLLR